MTYALPSEELESAIVGLEELVLTLERLSAQRDKLLSAPGTMRLRGWDTLYEEPESAREKLEALFSDCAARVDARYRELSARLPYSSVAEAENALVSIGEASAATEDDGAA
jgi:hypothetical protein